jgi:hypothetical protein
LLVLIERGAGSATSKTAARFSWNFFFSFLEIEEDYRSLHNIHNVSSTYKKEGTDATGSDLAHATSQVQ